MAWGSTAPAAIAALVAALATVDAAVVDGAVVSDSGLKEVVNVAYQTEDQDAVEMTYEPYTQAADTEEYVINCAVRVLRGRDLPAARARAFTLFGQVGSAIKTDPRLGGVVMMSRVSSGSLQTQPGQRGSLATILFSVHCRAETTE